MKDERGREVKEPLRRGGDHCVFHARPFCTRPAEEFTGAAVVVFLDLETSGLDVARDQVVEIAATEAPSDPAAFGASFATVVSGAPEPRGEAPPAVHGIAAEEIARGPPFPEAWSQFVAFAEGLLDARPRTSKITVTMPCVRGTVEEMIFLERYNVWKENRAGVEDEQDDD